jgi:hypothetical protein
MEITAMVCGNQLYQVLQLHGHDAVAEGVQRDESIGHTCSTGLGRVV